MSDHKINATLKAGVGYDAPWVTIGGDSEAEVAQNLAHVIGGTPQATSLFGLVAEAAAQLKGHYTATNDLGATSVATEPAPVQQEARAFVLAPTPQPVPQQAPPAPGQSCVHGVRTRREGSSSKGPWVGFFCPLRKGDPAQCAPVFENA